MRVFLLKFSTVCICVHLCFAVSSQSRIKKKKIDKMNLILQCKGWKQIEGISCDYVDGETSELRTVDVKDLTRVDDRIKAIVDEDNFEAKCKETAIVLGTVYQTVLYPLFRIYNETAMWWLADVKNEIVQIHMLEYFIKVVTHYYPLIACAIRSFEFLKVPNSLLPFLAKLKKWFDELSISIASAEDEQEWDWLSLSLWFEKLNKLNIVNEEFDGFSFNYSNSNFQQPLIREFIDTVTCESSENDRFLDLTKSGCKAKLEDAVVLFCHDFGFNDWVLLFDGRLDVLSQT